MINIGIDFGGTKIEAAALDRAGDFLFRERVANPGDYHESLLAIRDLVNRIEQSTGRIGTVGVGAPGSVSPATGVVHNANALWLNGKLFRQDLEEILGRPVRLANDANCMALSEAVDGAAAGYGTIFGVILGTGCGGGLVVDRALINGGNGLAGEWGHIALPWPRDDEYPGPACWCGHNNCIESWVSGTGLQRDYAEQCGQALSAEEIIARAHDGDAVARTAYFDLIDRLGRALAMISNLFDPDVFVFAGGLSNVEGMYDLLRPVITRNVFGRVWSGTLVQARWGDSSGVRGAARLWADSSD